MKAKHASLPVGARRLAAAVATLAVLTAVTTGSDSLAQTPTLSTPSVSIGGVRIDPGTLGVTVPTVPVAPPTAPAPVPELPPVPTVPKAPVEPPSTPDVPSPPRVDSEGVLRDGVEAVDRAGGGPSGRSLPPGSLDPGTVSRSGAAALPSTSGSSVGTGALARAGLVAPSLPTLSELAKLSPAQRRELIRRAFDTPLRERRLRQLRMTIRQYRGCLRALPYRGRHVLELRAGLLGEDPASRREIGRRLDESPRTVMRLERSSLRRLIDAGERGRCVGGSAATAFGGLAEGSDGPAGTTSGGGDGSDSPAGDVLADVHDGGPPVDLYGDEESPAETLLFFLLALLALLGPVALAIAARRRHADAAAPGPFATERPLLFLDVDGVIALDHISDGVPPGRIRISPLGYSYVPHRVGRLVRELTNRFDIVWATGWEDRANTYLRGPLGLRERLPVLTFGRKARYGSAQWKLKPVRAYAGSRPAAWLDDNFVACHERWAAHRTAPTLLVRVDSRVGLAPEHVERLIQWADGLAPSPAGEPAGARRLRAS